MARFIEDCPLPAELPTIPEKTCNFRIDQITRIIFYRLVGDLTTAFADEDALLEKANWETFLAAAGDDKGVMTPAIANFVLPGSEGSFYGGDDNTTVDGLPIYMGENNVTATGEFHDTPSEVIEAIRGVSQESNGSWGAPKIGMMFFNSLGQVGYVETGLITPDSEVAGIPVYSVRVGSANSDGYKQPTKNMFSLVLAEGWDQDVKLVTPNFNVKTLVAPATT